MKRPAILAIGAVLIWAATAAAQPAIIPRMARAPHDAGRTFEIVLRYLSNPQNGIGIMRVISEDRATHRIVARRSGIDTQTWGEWAYCKVSPEHLLDTLQNGSVTVTIKIDPAANNSSFVKVSSNFEATYGLGSSESTMQCVSRGVLEDNILRVAGAAPQNT